MSLLKLNMFLVYVASNVTMFLSFLTKYSVSLSQRFLQYFHIFSHCFSHCFERCNLDEIALDSGLNSARIFQFPKDERQLARLSGLHVKSSVAVDNFSPSREGGGDRFESAAV